MNQNPPRCQEYEKLLIIEKMTVSNNKFHKFIFNEIENHCFKCNFCYYFRYTPGSIFTREPFRNKL